MANLYFNGAVDTDWATLGNWWTDAACTVAASALPGSGDSVYISNRIDANSGGAPTVANLYFNAAQAFLISITVTGEFSFSIGSFGGNLTGNATFNSCDASFAYVTGNATFNSSTMNGGTVEGAAEFTGYSTILGNVMFGLGGSGTATLRGNTGIDGAGVTGNVLLYDSSGAFNGASISGNVESFDSGYLSNMSVGGSVTRNAPHSAGLFSGTAAAGGFYFGGSTYDFLPHSHYEVAFPSTVTYYSPTPVVFNLNPWATYYWSPHPAVLFDAGMPTVNLPVGSALYTYGPSYETGTIGANVNISSGSMYAPCNGNLYVENGNVYDEANVGTKVGGTATFINSYNGNAGYWGGSPGCGVAGVATYTNSKCNGVNQWWGAVSVPHDSAVTSTNFSISAAPFWYVTFNSSLTIDESVATYQFIYGEGGTLNLYAGLTAILGDNRGINGSSILGVV